MFAFERLEVYKRAKAMVKTVYSATAAFPAEERYGLTSQVRRAAISVVSNLAEGCARTSRKDQAHFTQLAYSSLMEVLCQLDLAQDLGFLSADAYALVRGDILAISKMLSGLRASQFNSSGTP